MLRHGSTTALYIWGICGGFLGDPGLCGVEYHLRSLQGVFALRLADVLANPLANPVADGRLS